MNPEEVVKQVIKLFVKKHKNYRESTHNLRVLKVWNRWAGILDIFRVYEKERIIIYNTCLFNKCDKRNLDEFVSMLGGDWDLVPVEYGYPLYYNHDFSIKLAR